MSARDRSRTPRLLSEDVAALSDPSPNLDQTPVSLRRSRKNKKSKSRRRYRHESFNSPVGDLDVPVLNLEESYIELERDIDRIMLLLNVHSTKLNDQEAGLKSQAETMLKVLDNYEAVSEKNNILIEAIDEEINERLMQANERLMQVEIALAENGMTSGRMPLQNHFVPFAGSSMRMNNNNEFTQVEQRRKRKSTLKKKTRKSKKKNIR